MTKTFLVTLELPVRVMTQEEWDEAVDGIVCLEPEEVEEMSRENEINGVTPNDFREAISAALNSANNPEVLAGTGMFVHTDDALVTSIGWKS